MQLIQTPLVRKNAQHSVEIFQTRLHVHSSHEYHATVGKYTSCVALARL